MPTVREGIEKRLSLASDCDDSHREKVDLVDLATQLSTEIYPARRPGRVDLDASLDRDWGFDSLSRAELLLRVGRACKVSLPERLLGEAETLRDILDALPDAAVRHGGGEAIAGQAGIEGVRSAPEAVSSLTQSLDWHAERHGENAHLLILGDAATKLISYAGLAGSARVLARDLRAHDVAPGDRVAIMLPTSEDFFIAFFGVLFAGAVPVPIYPPSRPAQIGAHLRQQAGILNNAGAVQLIADPAAGAAAQLLGMLVPSVRSVRTVETLSTNSAAPLPKVCASNVALLQYTSGSTGDPKGVVLTHEKLLSNIRAMGAVIKPTRQDIFVSWLPLYHDMGLIGAWLGSLHYGVPLVVMSPQRFLMEPQRWLWTIHQYRGTLSAAPNFAFELCLAKIDDRTLEGLDLSSLRLLANGAEAVRPATVRRFSERFGRYGLRVGAMAPVYGLAENAVGLAFPPMDRGPVIDRVDRDRLQRTGDALPATAETAQVLEVVACGRPLPGHEIRIVGESGEIGERKEGRIQFRGPSSTTGYFNSPQKTAELFDGSWLNTGDVGYLADGDIFVTGRSKDVIIRAGQHIYPQEIEGALENVSGIRKGCVVAFGVADPKSGTERLVVVAETRETDAHARSHIREEACAAVAVLLQTPPEEVLLVPARTLPKTSSGKIRRSRARQLYEQNSLGKHGQSIRMQVAGLALAAVRIRVSEIAAISRRFAYAIYWRALFWLFGAVTWPLILLLPGRRLRWALMHRLSRLLLALHGIRVQVSRSAPLPSEAVIVANHSSYIDGLVLSSVLPGELTFVAKQELEDARIAGPFLRRLGTIFVTRDASVDSVAGERRIFDAVQKGRRVIMFPEGTFQPAPGLLPFHLGAFIVAARASIPIVPVALKGTRQILRGEDWAARRGDVEVSIGAAIWPDGTDFDAAIRLRDAARQIILDGCGEAELLAL